MELFDKIFKEVKSYRKILQVVLCLIKQDRIDDAKMIINRVLTVEEIQEPMDEVLGGSSNDKSI